MVIPTQDGSGRVWNGGLLAGAVEDVPGGQRRQESTVIAIAAAEARDRPTMSLAKGSSGLISISPKSHLVLIPYSCGREILGRQINGLTRLIRSNHG